jgi:Zn-dependent protease with chaperone function
MGSRSLHGLVFSLMLIGAGYYALSFCRGWVLPGSDWLADSALWNVPNPEAGAGADDFGRGEGRRAVELWLANRPSEAIAECSRLVEQGSDPATALLWRARLEAAQGNLDDALDDVDDAMAFRPNDIALRSFRSILINSALAARRFPRSQSDRSLEIEGDDSPSASSTEELGNVQPPLSLIGTERWSLLGSDLTTRLRCVALLWVVILICTVNAGQRQCREAAGTWQQLVKVCAGLATIWLLPFVTWVGLSELFPEIALDDPLVLGLAMIVILLARACMQPPANFYVGKEPLPLCDNAQVLEQLAGLAKQLGVRCPRVRVQRSLDGSMNALVGGIAPPSLLISRDMLDRFKTDECNFVLAHELAHIANRSQWWNMLVWPLSLSMGVLAAMACSIWFAVPFTAALLVGLRRISCRHFERDCDRRAAQVVGFDAALRGLSNLHAVSLLPDRGWLSALAFATATHPPRDMRLAAVWEAAPATDKPVAPFERRRVQRGQWLARTAFFVWASVLCVSLWLETQHMAAAPAAVGVFAVALAPGALMPLTQRRRLAMERRRIYGKSGWRRLSRSPRVRVALVVAFVLLFQVGFTHIDRFIYTVSHWLGGSDVGAFGVLFADEYLGGHGGLWMLGLSMIAPLLLVLLVLWMTRWATHGSPRAKRTAFLTQQVNAALQRGDYREIVRLADAELELFRSDPILRYNAAVSLAGTGDRARGIEQLEALRADRPDLPLSWLVLSCLYLDEDQPDRALELARGVMPLLKPNDPAPHGLAAWALRRLGRVDEALAACEQARSYSPEDGALIALSAELALDRGDIQEVDRLLALADAKAPGHLTIRMAKVERALAAGSEAEIAETLAHARKMVRQHPLVFLDRELARFEARAAERQCDMGKKESLIEQLV